MPAPALDAATPARTGSPRLVSTVALAATGPLAIGAIRAVLPYDTVDDPAAAAERIQAAPAAASTVLWLILLAVLTLPIGLAIACRLAMRVRRVFGTVAAVVAWVGFLSLFGALGIDYTAPAAASSGLPLDDLVALDAAMTAHPAASLAIGVFVLGHILGAVLLGIALWGVLPHWAAAGLIVSQPLHFVFVIVWPQHVLDALAWSLTGAAFAAAALAAARLAPR
ncbi:MAG: hypothetical protein L0H64_13630 [Pseudonocardia sp.]|nr:hypothetical protein [Pseudonocardia sp.]